MVFPLVAGGLAVGLSALYNTGMAIDNVRYWNDYYRRYHVRPKYPFRAGYFDYMKYSSKSFMTPYVGYGMYRK